MEYRTKYIQEDDVWAVIDSVDNHVEYFIHAYEAQAAARKLNITPLSNVRRCRGVNYREEDFAEVE